MRMLGGIRDIEYNEGNILISQSQSEIKSLDQIKSGEFFYGLLHRRYVLTNAGINKILKNFDEGRRNKIVRISSLFQDFTENVRN